MMYGSRREAAAACEYEGTAASHFSKVAIQYAHRGLYRKAWDLVDTAQTAAKCAMQAHEELWALAGENLTEAEFKAFEKAEIGLRDASNAARVAAEAVRKQNAAQHELPPELEALCKESGVRSEGIKALMRYYTDKCDWTEQQAIEHIKAMFADGTIAALTDLK